MRTIIALAGLKTSGKTTAFNIIGEIFEGKVIEIQLAKKLKDVCASVLNVERSLFDDPARKEVNLEDPVYLDGKAVTAMIEAYGITPDYDKHVRPHVGTVLESPRRIAQYVGTEILRNVSEDIHCIGATMNLPEDGTFVLTDMRFPNEFNFFNEKYGANFYPYYIQSNRAEFGAKDMHPSEALVMVTAKNCKKIENNGTIQELKNVLIKELVTMGITKMIASLDQHNG